MEDRIYELLQTVIDPEVNINIIDMGLVYDIKIEDNTIDVAMTLSAKGCPLGDTIMEAAENAVKSEFAEYKININLVWEPEWNPSLISEEGKRQLGM